MNILSITGILPIPDFKKINDFLIPLYTTYKKVYPQSEIYFLLPVKFDPFSKNNLKIHKLKSYELQGFKVQIFPYLSAQRFRNIHAILCCTLFWFNKIRIKQLLKDKNIEIVHAEYILPDGLLALFIKKYFNIPYVITTHKEDRYFKRFLSKRFSVKILKNAGFVTPLNYASKILYENNDINKTVIVPHGVDYNFLNAKHNYKQQGKINILTIAQLLKYKNIDKVILALAQINEKHDFHYNIIGNGPEKEYLEELIAGHELSDKVTIIGKIPYDEIVTEMNKHDIFILVSYFETFGRVLFEAMAVGLPIICARDTGIHGYFKEGKEGFSVRHDDIDDIKYKLLNLIENPQLRVTVGLNAKKLTKSYTWNNIVRTFHELYIRSIGETNTKNNISL